MDVRQTSKEKIVKVIIVEALENKYINHIDSNYKISLWRNSRQISSSEHTCMFVPYVMFMACDAHCFSEVWKQKAAE